ncbi:ribonuclease P protein component [Nitratiruptor tergarcus]|uniref:ribonuclease P protein component n=1 Tax=Nitratiruptor tergarcus TaxID=269259 RepID=UPI0009FF6B15|nr:ribonuclease P protein component [Nitratiruptor tergarcus]
MKGVQTLKTKREFDFVYKKGVAFHTPFFVLFYLHNKNRKVGFVASKKVGKAVKRNRAKRVLKALFIKNFEQFPTGEYVFVAKQKILETDFKRLDQEMQNILNRIKRRKW